MSGPAVPDAGSLMQLVYTSQAHDSLPLPALDALLADCRSRNRDSGVTGVLLVHQGAFLQCLEGRPAVVAETFARITRDGRHRAVTETYRGAIAERSFPTWYMACAHVDASWWLRLSTTAWETFRLAAHATTPGLAFLDAVWTSQGFGVGVGDSGNDAPGDMLVGGSYALGRSRS